MALMILYTQWISLFVTHTFGFNAILSHWLLSLYSMGSISGVLIIFVLLKNNLSENKLVIALNLFSFLALLVICYSPNALLSKAGSQVCTLLLAVWLLFRYRLLPAGFPNKVSPIPCALIFWLA